MGVAKRTRKFGAVKRLIGSSDARLKKNISKAEDEAKKKAKEVQVVREVPQVSSALFFQYNTALVPPYSVLVDTNFLSHTVQRKLPLLETMMDTLYAKCNPILTSCVMAELEKLGPRYRIALRIARDERFERLKCDHKGTYADDCIVDRVQKSKIYSELDFAQEIQFLPSSVLAETLQQCTSNSENSIISLEVALNGHTNSSTVVATNDKDLKRRIRKVPGVPIMSVARGKYVIERLPDAPEK